MLCQNWKGSYQEISNLQLGGLLLPDPEAVLPAKLDKGVADDRRASDSFSACKTAICVISRFAPDSPPNEALQKTCCKTQVWQKWPGSTLLLAQTCHRLASDTETTA